MEDCPTCNQPIYNVRGAIADMAKLVAERDKLLLQNERLQKKVDQMRRFTECFVAHPYEGTLECDPSKPCPFCRYTSMERLLREAQDTLKNIIGFYGPGIDGSPEEVAGKLARECLEKQGIKDFALRPVCDCLGHDHDGPEVCACCCMKVNDRGPDLCSKCGANRAHWTTR